MTNQVVHLSKLGISTVQPKPEDIQLLKKNKNHYACDLPCFHEDDVNVVQNN